MSLRFDNQTVVITAVSHGLGRHYATYLASHGADVVVHDSVNTAIADIIVDEIRAAGGRAKANYIPLDDGDALIAAAVAQFGRITVLINNAGDQLDVDWTTTSTDEWDSMLRSNFRNAYKCVHAAWPHFKKQRYGRIISTASIVEAENPTDTVLRSAATYGHLGFAQTLAKEGAKYDILASVVAPSLHATQVQTESVVQMVGNLVHRSNTGESGHLYEIGAGRCCKSRWQRSGGALLNPGPSLEPGALLNHWKAVNDFSKPAYPCGSANFTDIFAKAKRIAPSAPGKRLRLDGKVALVTGAASGLGRAYAKYLASLGACVVLNDVNDLSKVAKEIKEAGGETYSEICSVEDADKIVGTAIQHCGRIDIVVNNAGFVRDKSIGNMTDTLWDSIMAVHLKGTFRVTRAVWPYMVKHRYGRIINVSSTSGIYGNFGQANYSTAKCAIIGFSEALAREGARHEILVNVIAPAASTPALGVAIQGSPVDLLPEYVAPMVALLSSDERLDPPTGGLYELGAGWHARTRLQTSHGCEIRLAESDDASSTLVQMADFDGAPVQYREELDGGLRDLACRIPQRSVSNKVEQVKRRQSRSSVFTFTVKDVTLYNLTLGATWTELPLIYERNKDFAVLPTFGAIPFFNAALPFTFDEILPKWDPNKYLHGEHYLEVRKFPLPTSGTLVTHSKLVDVVDKKKAAVVTVGYTTRDANTGDDVFYNESSIYVRGAGAFGGPSERTISTAHTEIPRRAPDLTREERTLEEQAALYRLNGDLNDLHVNLSTARQAGYPRPILHGLCFFGISGKHIYQAFGPIKNIQVRFAGPVLPGQTLRTEMWRSRQGGAEVIGFQTKVVETDKLCISGGRAELFGGLEMSRL